MSEDCKTVVVTLTDKDYYPRAKRTIIDIRTRGQWTGDIVLVTIGFHASQNFLDFYQVTEKQFEPISTTYLLEQYRKYPLQTVSDNRHLNKVAQWNKFYLFDEWFTQWRRIIFMDAGLPKALFIGIVMFQLMIIPTVFKVSSDIAPKAK